MARRRSGGFTLLELMIIVALIGIVAAIAIPGVEQARISANEASAIGTLRTIRTANVQYRVRFSSYAGALTDLQSTGYIDPAIASPFKAGYTFSYAQAGGTFQSTAVPTDPGESGNRYFYVDETGVLRFSTTGPADATDDPL